MRKFLLILILQCLLPLAVFARTYQLEMLVYKQLQIGRDHEMWQMHPAEPEAHKRYGQANPATPRDLFYYKKLLEGKTNILLQRAWQFSDDSIINLNFDENPAEHLWGYLTIRLGHYIEINTDLLYEAATSELPSSLRSQFEESLAKFPLKDKRRLVPGVVYYYDHPMIGMIVKVNAVG